MIMRGRLAFAGDEGPDKMGLWALSRIHKDPVAAQV